MLDPTADAPAFGYAYGFLLPADCLRLLSVAPGIGAGVATATATATPDPTSLATATLLPAAVPGGVCYAIEGRRLLAMAAPLQVLYVAGGDAADETQWDASLREALTTALAAKLAYPVTQSAALGQAMEAKFQQLLREARATNASEHPSDPVPFESPSLAARGGPGTGTGPGLDPGPAAAWWQRAWLVPSEPR